jgi:hypothetical protein
VQILDVAVGAGRPIERFGSTGSSHLGGATFEGAGGVAFLRLAPGGHLGRHPTMLAQLFSVVTGSGWVAGEDGVRHALTVGQAALWEPGEEHEAGSDEGMMVAVVEAGTIRVRT